MPREVAMALVFAFLCASCGEDERQTDKRPTARSEGATPETSARNNEADSPAEIAYRPRSAPESTMRTAIETRLLDRELVDLQISVEKGAALPKAFTVDIESGSGHGASLSFLRMTVTDDRVDLEDIEWEDGKPARVWRASTARANLDAFLELIDVARRVKVETREKALDVKPNPDGTIGLGNLRTIGSSVDFFVLLRILGPDGGTLHEAEYAGYESSSDQNHYLPLNVLVSESGSLTEDRRGWTEVAGGELRSSHFTDAFSRNKTIMLEEFHWWVLEYSLKALASLGDPEALDALAFIRSTYPDSEKATARRCAKLPTSVRDYCLDSPSRQTEAASHDEMRDRHLAMIDRITASKERYLEGPPAAWAEVEDRASNSVLDGSGLRR